MEKVTNKKTNVEIKQKQHNQIIEQKQHDSAKNHEDSSKKGNSKMTIGYRK